MNIKELAGQLNERQNRILEGIDEEVRPYLVEPYSADKFASASDVYAAAIILCRREKFPWQIITYFYQLEMKCRQLEMRMTRPVRLKWRPLPVI
jgi:hypothetical protein